MSDKCPSYCTQLSKTSSGQPYCAQHNAALETDATREGGQLRYRSCVGPVVAVRDDGVDSARAKGWRDDLRTAVVGHVMERIARAGPPRRISSDGLIFDIANLGPIGTVAMLVPVGPMGENAERFERMSQRISWLKVLSTDARRGIAFVRIVVPGDVP